MVLTRKDQFQLSSSKKAAANAKQDDDEEPAEAPEKKKRKPKAKAKRQVEKPALECSEDEGEEAPLPKRRGKQASGKASAKKAKVKEPAWSEPVPEDPEMDDEEPEPKPKKGKTEPRPAEERQAANTIATFARRYRPSLPFYAKKWDSLKAAYTYRVRPFVKDHSKLEDFYEAAC